MAEIRAFHGIRYNQPRVGDLARVICPPYDIIPPQMQAELYARSEYNFVRVEDARELPQDSPQDNKHTRAAATLGSWLREGVLQADEVPGLYLHDAHFIFQGKSYRRRSVIVRVRLEEWEKGIICPHEGTLSQPRGDRLSLLWACQANTSPILALYQDREGKIAPVLAREARRKPLLRIDDADGQGHRLWAITAPGAMSVVQDTLAPKSIYIADGHHRYESSLAYQREQRARTPVATGEEAFNFVMMTLVEFADAGLLNLSPHRLVRGIPRAAFSALAEQLKAFFTIETVPLDEARLLPQTERLLADDGKGTKLVLFGLAPGNLLVLRLRDPARAGQLMPQFHSELYRQLGVSLIDHIILEKLLGLSLAAGEANLAYSYDRREAIRRVSDQEFQLALLLQPIPVETIKAIADRKDRMPRKSTYFYPKEPAGLVVNRLV